MVKLEDVTTIMIRKMEVQILKRELEELFGSIPDKTRPFGGYSGESIKKSHPKMWELFTTL